MKAKDIQLYEYYLEPGYIFLNHEPSTISTVLGSCIVVSLWACKKNYGGMAHYLYPFIENREEATAKYGNVAINCLINMFREWGSATKDISAQIFGGASLKQSSECARIAEENIRIAKGMLKKNRIKIISEDVGGNMGRKLIYNTFSNEAVIYKTKKVRGSDWYPYNKR